MTRTAVFRPLAVVASLVFAAGAALFLASGLARAATEASPPAPEGLAKATFAGGCFWCMEQPFEALPGVKSAISGYTGGSKANPAYRQVSGGSTGHAEAVEVLYDPKVVGYERLLEVFWANIDPTVKDRQFCDVGSEYRTAIFVHDAAQRAAAEASLAKWQADPRFAGQTLYTQIADAATFWVAEDYHQDYAAKNPAQYKYYRWGCGRDARLKQVWGQAPAG
ncbi:MAG: peptide-methionine (S)-S-oxide reductase MsrA [Pseudomonadota bacterium]